MTALDLSRAIATRALGCEEVMRAYLAQIARYNPQVNAIVSLRDEAALLAEARACDAELARGERRGWLHGMPFAVKDLADVEGMITTRGSPIFRDAVAASDSIHIGRIRRDGAIFVGKTNVPEFGLGSQSYNPVFGPARNPWDVSRTPGGSSGGAAAALSLRMAPVADGSDFMGSLRNPAAFCNVIGFRPTPGLIPLARGFAEELPVNGPMGRNVADTAALLATMAGFHPASPSSLAGDPLRFLGSLARDWRGARIGWLGDLGGYLAMEPGVIEVCETALRAFADVGVTVEAASLDYDMASLWQTWLTFRHSSNRAFMLPLYANRETRRLLKPEARWEIRGGAKISADDVSRASGERARFYAALVRAFERYDFLVLPSAQLFPFAAETHWPREIAGRRMDTYHRWMEVVVPGTLSGCPVINVPAGFSSAGLPMGMQIIAPRYGDRAALEIAWAYEQASRWNLDFRPPLLAGDA
ncbi:MAG: amidase [Pseudomonadota bacterium]